MAGNPIRLRKAAQEFNVGTSTIIEFLEKKGHVLEDNPNTKISEELYNLLVVEFKKDKETKLGAEKINIGSASNRQTITIADKPKKDLDDEVKWESTIQDDHLMIRDTSLSKEPVVAVKPEEKSLTTPSEIKEKERLKVPVIIDKIDLSTIEPAKPKKKPATKKEIEKPAKTIEPEVKKELVEKQAVEKEEKTTTVEMPKVKPEPEKIEIKAPEIKLTVLGSIDVEDLKTKSKKKSIANKEREKNERKQKEKEEKKVAVQQQQAIEKPKPQPIAVPPEIKPEAAITPKEEPKPEKIEDNVIRVRVPQMQGPKILDTIDLSQFNRPSKPVASSSDDLNKKSHNHKKKRPRTETGNKTTKAPDQQPQRKGQPSTKSPNQQPHAVHPKKDQKHAKKRAVKIEPKIAPSEEEIKKQISDTLSKLTSTNKSKASKHRKEKREGIREKMAAEAQRVEAEKNILKVTEFITANELANMMDVPVTNVIKKCMEIGLFVSINQRLDAETIVFIADEFGYQVTFIDAEDQENRQEEDSEIDTDKELLPRHPVVTVMGHVDHGKTKLLDYIRHSNVVAGEAGGITQHIGAYSVTLDDGRKITFLDTPGHEAFTAMRARGAKMTDVAIIVIAADDNVMPQTKEAINHAQAANVPIVFAINKIDKPTADPDKIRQQLSTMNILVEDWGGKYQCQEISAKAGTNVDLLLEKVLLEAEVLELKANPTRSAKGSVIESKLEPGRGYVASVLVQNGTLRKSDIVLAGQYYGRIKALFNERYQPISEVPPATPALILGLNGAPQAGDTFSVMKEERDARIAATKRQQLQREIGLRTQKHITLDDIGRNIARGSFKELNIIVKGDVDGSVEALSDSLLKLSSDEVKLTVIHKSVGAITESDVLLASASNAIIIGFQVRPSVSARKLAESEEIDIRLYSIIYDAIEEIKAAIEGMLTPEIKEDVTCNVEVREIFKIHKMGTIAGCLVLDGTITRDTKVRIIRDGIVIYTGTLASLKRYKDDVKEVRSGMECGLNINNFNDIKVGDIIEGYREIEIKRILT